MGTHRRHTPLLLALLAAGAASAATLQPQPLVPGYGKEFRQFGNYNGIPIAPRPSPWIRAAEIQSADAAVYPGERQQPSFPEQQVPFGNAIILQRRGPQYPVLPAAPEQQAPPADGFIYQRMGPPPLGPGPYNGDQVPQKYEHSMLLIDHPPGQMMSQQQQPGQQTIFSGDQMPHKYEHSMLLIDHPPDQMMPQQQQPDQQTIVRREDGAAGEPVQYEHSMLEVHGTSQQQDQQPDMSGDPMPAGSPAEETVQVQVPSADQQPSAQESSGAIAQVTQPDSSVPQGPMAPMLMPYQQGQRPLGVIFQSNEPYPGLSPPPAYQPEQVAWGVPPVQMPAYPAPFREQPPQQGQQPGTPTVVEFPRPAGYPDDFQVKGGYQPFLSQRQGYNPPLVSFGMPPVAEDRVGAVPPPPGGVAPFPMPPSYVPETPLEETSQAEVVPDKNEQSESHETEKSKDGDAKDDDDDDASDEIENKVKALKDAVDVEEEVVPALVVFLRKKGHKAFHDKDSVGIPGKEDRFRRSPGGGSGSSSHSSSSSSSSSGPLYFGDGGGSYSSSSSQSSASSSSGGGAPLGLGAGAPGLGGGNGFYGGGHAPSSGYGVSGGGSGGSGGYGNTGYGNTGYGSSGYGGGAGGSGGGGGYGGSGYGGGVGPSGGGGSYGGGCSSCGDDSNVLLNRFGEVEGGGPFTVGGSGTSKGQGVHSSASSSIDSTGKVTYTAFAGKH
ncbi:proton channel OtopLc-like isoform X1 [Schistocerca nitens]|uniref:proton channel OtopLc-like isoform X1 n=1 Tax=Schistocerca nitens TaxID=7011 RepID=UPI002117D3A3|nr:proton channel OtopLc-like isoform X1 [Schistocerca nitens]